MGVEFKVETNIGNKRQVNEDSLWPETNHHLHRADEPYGMLFIVADGMGGHGAGDVASNLAVNAISTAYYALGDEHPDIGDRLKLAIEAAHQKICARALESPDLENMGTTLVAAVVKYDEVYEQGELWVAWAGDSRVYMLRHGQLQQLTKDHSRVWSLIENGQITWDELRFHPDRSKVTNALAAHRTTVVPEVERFDLEPADQILLCSDGLAGEVRPEEIAQILNAYPPQQAVQLLIEKANAPSDVLKDGQIVKMEGGKDNITSILVNIPSGEPQPILALPIPVPAPVPAAVPAHRPGFNWIIAAILLLLILAGAGLFLALSGWGREATDPTVTSDQASVPPAATVINADTPLPAALVVIGQTPTLTPQPDAISPEPPPTSDEVRTPTVTRGPVSSPTPPPATFTPVPPTATPLITSTQSLTAGLNPADFPAPTLIEPEEYQPGQPDFIAGQDIKFAWQWPGQLPENFGFEIRVWIAGNNAVGLYDAKELKSILQADPQANHAYSVTLKLVGAGIITTDTNYLWSVGIVQLEPYQWLNIESQPRRLSIVVPDPK